MKGRNYRIVGLLASSDIVMNRTFWVGVYPGLTEPHLDHVLSSIRDFVCGRQSVKVTAAHGVHKRQFGLKHRRT